MFLYFLLTILATSSFAVRFPRWPHRRLTDDIINNFQPFRYDREILGKLEKIGKNHFRIDTIPTQEIVKRIYSVSGFPKVSQILKLDIHYPAYTMEIPHFVTLEDKAWFDSWNSTSNAHKDLKSCKENKISKLCLLADPNYETYYGSAHFTRGSLTSYWNVIIDPTKGECSDQDYGKIISFDDKSPPLLQKAAFLKVYDGWSFQHFVDRAMPKLSQAKHWLERYDKKDLFILSQNHLDDMVPKLFRQYGFNNSHILDYPKPVKVKEFLEICNAPFIHPVLWQSMRTEMLKGISPKSVADRKKIIYLQRSSETAENALRQPIQEPEILSLLYQIPGYELVIFDHKKYASVIEIAELMSSAALVIGPHGGAFTNNIMLPAGTVIVELLPKGIDQTIFWMGSRALSHVYWMVPCEGQWNSVNIDCDLNKIKSIVHWHLLDIETSILGGKCDPYNVWGMKSF